VTGFLQRVSRRLQLELPNRRGSIAETRNIASANKLVVDLPGPGSPHVKNVYTGFRQESQAIGSVAWLPPSPQPSPVVVQRFDFERGGRRR
jgi:hypothetical protein